MEPSRAWSTPVCKDCTWDHSCEKCNAQWLGATNYLKIPSRVFGRCWRTLWLKRHDVLVTRRRMICKCCRKTLFRFPRSGSWEVRKQTYIARVA